MRAKKRDNNYYRLRLRRDFPTVYSDLIAGKHKTVRQAAIAAGLIHQPSRLQALKREWSRANTAEQKAFATWAKAKVRTARSVTKPVAHPDGRLTASATAFLSEWMSRNGVTAGRIMKEIGRSNYDYRLAEAIRSRKALPEDVLKDLSEWMRKNGYSSR